MVAIAPFRAVRYRPGLDLRRVTSPPHDTISPAQRDALLARDPRNIVHVTLGPEQPGDRDDDPAGPNKYRRAAEALRRWTEAGDLVRDAKPAFYLYEVRQPLAAGGATMRGFFCRVGLDPTYTRVRRHEATLRRSKRDRLRLLEATDCNPEPIWMLYRDERGWVEEVLTSNAFDELACFVDDEGNEHRLWRVDRPEAVQEVVAQFDERDLVIADGHHRYQTSLDRFAATGRPEDGSILVCLTRDTDPGVRIRPTHRLVLDGPPTAHLGDAAAAVARAAGAWTARELDAGGDDAAVAARLLAALDGDARRAVVVGEAAGRLRAWLLELRAGHEVDTGLPPLDALAVTRVHARLLHDAWGLSAEGYEGTLKFTQDAAAAVAATRTAPVRLAVLLPPEAVHAVLDVAEAGAVMPPKATFFVPKPQSGLVLGPCDEPAPVRWVDSVKDPGPMEFRRPPL